MDMSANLKLMDMSAKCSLSKAVVVFESHGLPLGVEYCQQVVVLQLLNNNAKINSYTIKKLNRKIKV
jgi:ABC-type Na+ transport system ATPase subunit NatA